MATKYLVSFPGSLAPECDYTGRTWYLCENLKYLRAKIVAEETGNLVHALTDFKFSQTANLKPV